MAKLRVRVATALAVLTALALVIVLPLMRSCPEPPASAPASSGVVVLGMTGVPWELIGEDTPNLWEFARQSGTANMVVKTFRTTTCPDGGWLTLNTGVRTASTDQQTACTWQPPQDLADSGARWQNWVALNVENGYHPQFGILARTLAEAGKSTAAVGDRAAIALLNEDGGFTGKYRAAAGGDAAALAAAYTEVAGADLVLVDLGTVLADSALPANSGLNAAFAGPADISGLKAHVKELDANLGAVLAEIASDKAVLVASLADADAQTARLQYLALRTNTDGTTGATADPVTAAGTLYTSSTRQPGLVQLTDLQPTILALLGLPEIPGTIGAAAWVVPDVAAEDAASAGTSGVAGGAADSVAAAGGRIANLADTALRTLYTRPAVGPFYIGFTLFASVFIVVAAAARLHRRQVEISPRRRFFRSAAAAVIVSLPVSSMLSNLLPWWRMAAPVPIFLTLCVLISLLLAAIALGIGYQGGSPAAVIAAITAATFALDAIYGSHLHSISVLGDQPQSGGRFYGISNAPFVIFALSMLLLTVYVVQRLRRDQGNILAILMLLAMAAIAVIVDGSPTIGADFGGPPPLIIGFAVLGLWLLGRQFTARIGVIVAAAAAGVALLISFADWLRPAHTRTHLGVFFQSLIDGEAARVVARKANQLFTAVPWPVWIAVVVMVLGAAVWWRLRAEKYGLSLRPRTDLGVGAASAVILVLSAFVINDSGLVIPFIGTIFGIPLWISAYWHQQATAELPAELPALAN